MNSLIAAFAPPVLYHYTSGAGLLGIVEKKALWATRAQYLNDGNELKQAFDVVLSVLDEFRDRNGSGIAAFRKYLSGTRISASIYISSFSERGDELSQWRAYGRTGDSYSLGLDGPSIAAAATQQGWRLAPCIYDVQEQMRIMRFALNNFCGQFEQGMYGPELDPDPDSRFLRYCYGSLLPLAPTMKHPAFIDEREWRLISPVSGDLPLRHRPGLQSLIPYTSFPLPLVDQRLRIPRTYVGPGTADAVTAMNAVTSVFSANNVADDWQVAPSFIPYRNW